MGIDKVIPDVMSFIKKYKYVILVLLAGVILMVIPELSFSENKSEAALPAVSPTVTMSQELEEILCNIEGAGKTKVMMSYSMGEEIFYQTDVDLTNSETQKSEKIKTVIITGNDKAQSGLVSRVDPAKYLGVIVLCQGAEQASVRLAITDAVSKITGLGADRISVLKMK